MRIVLATGNAHKVAELRAILGPLLGAHELVGLGEAVSAKAGLSDYPEPIEDGLTYSENALIKARAAALASGLPALADDSGIEVDHLGGAPGIHSARYAGTRDDGDNRRKLLAEMEGVRDRRAAFVCAAALVDPRPGIEQRERVRREEWSGTLLEHPAGDGGFGYDPLFRPEGEHGSAAELSADEKNASSHRARAFRALWAEIAPGLGA